jgi:hypothetical protein
VQSAEGPLCCFGPWIQVQWSGTFLASVATAALPPMPRMPPNKGFRSLALSKARAGYEEDELLKLRRVESRSILFQADHFGSSVRMLLIVELVSCTIEHVKTTSHRTSSSTEVPQCRLSCWGGYLRTIVEGIFSRRERSISGSRTCFRWWKRKTLASFALKLRLDWPRQNIRLRSFSLSPNTTSDCQPSPLYPRTHCHLFPSFESLSFLSEIIHSFPGVGCIQFEGALICWSERRFLQRHTSKPRVSVLQTPSVQQQPLCTLSKCFPSI